MRRRDFITLLGGAAAWPRAARAQQPAKAWRIGFLAGGSRPIPVDSNPYGSFSRGMRELGYIEGHDFTIEWRFAEGRVDAFPDLAGELVRLKVDVIVLGTPGAVPAVQRATSTIPIVMGDSTDPVGRGFVASLAHPGGNITGLANSRDDTAPKQIELLAATVPKLKDRVGFALNPDNIGHPPLLTILEAAAHKTGLALLPVEMRKVQDIAGAFAILTEKRVGAVLFPADPFFFSQRQLIAELASKAHLPTMFTQREYVEAGGLMYYGESLADFYFRAAFYVDKILRGVKPADLPIQQPTRFFLVINLKAAKALDLVIPPNLLAIADEVIE
jgi:putative tryptophan/tyrosine transport system substrate-binding protein